MSNKVLFNNKKKIKEFYKGERYKKFKKIKLKDRKFFQKHNRQDPVRSFYKRST